MKENKQETIGLKFDSEKVDWSLVPLRSIEEIAKVLAMGKKKYGAWNWIHVDDATNRYTSALLRHLTAIQEGESLDSESGLSHLSHLACNALFLVYLDLHKNDLEKPENILGEKMAYMEEEEEKNKWQHHLQIKE